MRQKLPRLHEFKATERACLKPEADWICRDYIETKITETVQRVGCTPDEARAAVEKSIGGKLLPDYGSEFASSKLGQKTVGEVLENPSRFNGEYLAHPIDGPSRGRQKAAAILREDGSVYIKCFSHGGGS